MKRCLLKPFRLQAVYGVVKKYSNWIPCVGSTLKVCWFWSLIGFSLCSQGSNEAGKYCANACNGIWFSHSIHSSIAMKQKCVFSLYYHHLPKMIKLRRLMNPHRHIGLNSGGLWSQMLTWKCRHEASLGLFSSPSDPRSDSF